MPSSSSKTGSLAQKTKFLSLRDGSSLPGVNARTFSHCSTLLSPMAHSLAGLARLYYVNITRHGAVSMRFVCTLSPGCHLAHSLKLPKVIDIESGHVEDYSNSSLRVFANFFQKCFTAILASLYPILAILALHSIPSTLERIEVTIGFTVALGLFLTFFTSAKTKDVIAATAA